LYEKIVTGITAREPRTKRHIIGRHKKHEQPRSTNKIGVQPGAREDKQFLFLIRHPLCYAYIQSSPVKALAVIEEWKHLSKM